MWDSVPHPGHFFSGKEVPKKAAPWCKSPGAPLARSSLGFSNSSLPLLRHEKSPGARPSVAPLRFPMGVQGNRRASRGFSHTVITTRQTLTAFILEGVFMHDYGEAAPGHQAARRASLFTVDVHSGGRLVIAQPSANHSGYGEGIHSRRGSGHHERRMCPHTHTKHTGRGGDIYLRRPPFRVIPDGTAFQGGTQTESIQTRNRGESNTSIVGAPHPPWKES
jgi:hypothetical protein